MAAEKDPAEVVRTIARSIQVSQRGARRVRARRFKELFGYQALSAQRRQRIEELLTELASLCSRPSRKRGAMTGWSCLCRPRYECRRPSRIPGRLKTGSDI